MFDFFKKIKMPHVFTLIAIVIFVCSLLTYVVPSGSFEREQKIIDGHERTLIVPNTYHTVPKHFSLKGLFLGDAKEGTASPVSLHGFLSAIPRGMERANKIIFFIFVIGGVFGILQKTGVITATIHKLLVLFGGQGPLLTIVIMLAISIGGSTLGMGEEFIPLVPIFIIVANHLGYDRIYGLSMVILASQVGFASATTNPFTVGVAQGIAELPLYSGSWFRILFYLCAILITITYVLRYGKKVKMDQNASLVVDLPVDFEGEQHQIAFKREHGFILGTSIIIFGLILFAVANMGWWMADMAGGFLLIGGLAAVFARLSLGEATLAFVKGMEDMVVAALVVGFAKGIEVVLSDGLVMDTIIYYAADLLASIPKVAAIQGMFFFQTVLNFLIPSGSGQAAVTMPLMAPLADVLGISRQTAVLAFQFGDGFSNTLIPTSGILMAMLSLARIPYERWLRFIFPLFLMLSCLAVLFLALSVSINYS